MQHTDKIVGILFGILGIYLIYRSIVLKKIDIGELFTEWIIKYKYNWIVTLLLLISISIYVYDMNVYRQKMKKLQSDYTFVQELFEVYYQAWEASEQTNSHRETYGFWYELQEAKDSIEACTGKPYKVLDKRYPIQSISID